MREHAAPRRSMPRAAAVIAVVFLAVVASVWAVQAVRKAQRSTGNDLVGYLSASEALYAGEDPYRVPGRFPYIYPLFLATVIHPLTRLPPAPASITWFAVECVCLGGILLAALQGRVPPRAVLVLVAALVAVFADVLQSEFVNAQVNLIVLALGMAALHVERRSAVAAGAVLGTAIALKLTPALLLVYWAIERRWIAMITAGASAVLLMASSWLVIGERTWSLYAGYLNDFLLPRVGTPSDEAIVFSASSMLSRAGAPHVVGTCAAVLVVLLIGAWHLSRREEPDVTLKATPYFAAILLLSPMSEVHHLTALIPAAALAMTAAWHPGAHAQRIAFSVFVLLLWQGRFDRSGPWYFLAILLLAGTAMFLVRGQRLERAR